MYRLSDVDEFFAIGGEEYFEKGASIVEWGEMIEEILPKNYIKINFSRNLDYENKRDIRIYVSDTISPYIRKKILR